MRGTQSAMAACVRHLLLQFMTTNVIQSMICIIGGLCCLIPLCFEPLREYDGPYTRVSLTSERYRDLAVAAIALTIPIFLEIITETIASVRSAFSLDKDEIKVQQALINTPERFMLAGAVLTTSTIALMSDNSENYINTYICASKCRMTFVGGAIAASLCRFDSSYWSVRSTYFMLCLLISSSIMGSFADNMIRANSTIDYVASALFLSAFAIFSYCNIMWLYSFGPTFYREVTSQALSDNSSRRSCSALSYQHLYVVIVAVVSLVTIITRKIYPELESLNSSAVFHHNMGVNTYLILLLYISERMMKYEILQGLVSHLSVMSAC